MFLALCGALVTTPGAAGFSGISNYQDDRWHVLDEYRRYIEDNQDKFPLGIRPFMLADWYHNTRHHQCPHDSWVNSIDVKEISSGSRQEIRMINIIIALLGVFHDGSFEIEYINVQEYEIRRTKPLISSQIGHGDWIIDEFNFESVGIRHEILFSNANFVCISKDVQYRWCALPQQA